MQSVHVKKYKLNIGNKEYTFELNMLNAIKVEEKYGSFAEIFNYLLVGEKFYNNAFKLLSCCCLGKDWDCEELAAAFPIELSELKKLDAIVQEMYGNFEAFKEKNKDEKEKN